MIDNIEKKLTDYMYYGIVGIISLLALVFLPFMGSAVGMGWNLPSTVPGWIVFIVSKIAVALINILLFHSFVKQSRLNIKDDPRYLEAVNLLRASKLDTYIPRSLEQLNHQEYRTKVITIFITSLVSAFSLGQAILTFDWMSFLSYLFTVTMGIVFGILEMKKYEDYYTSEYLDYAKMIYKETQNVITEERENTGSNCTEAD